MTELRLRLDDAGEAPILRYDAAEQTFYFGRNLIDLGFPTEYFLLLGGAEPELPDNGTEPSDLDAGPIDPSQTVAGPNDTQTSRRAANTMVVPHARGVARQPVPQDTAQAEIYALLFAELPIDTDEPTVAAPRIMRRGQAMEAASPDYRRLFVVVPP